jgi:hypothetical protein
LGVLFSSKVSKKLRWELGGKILDFRLVTADSIKQKDYLPISKDNIFPLTRLPQLFPWSSLFFKPYFNLYYSPSGDKFSQVFVKMAFPYQIGHLNEGVAYLQLEVGYTVAITKFLKALKGP